MYAQSPLSQSPDWRDGGVLQTNGAASHPSVMPNRLGMADDEISMGVKCKMQVNFLQERKSVTLEPDNG